MLLSQSILIHFIEPINDVQVKITTTFRSILVQKGSVIIHWSRPIHIVFVQLLNKTYYLAVVQKIYNPSDRCPHINELFNESFVQWHLIRRIKYYHLPCQQQSWNLSCFHDNDFHCLCYDFNQQRLANCFKFDANMTFDCSGENECENGGQCFQDALYCPQRLVCSCPPCYYGIRCQFTTSGFGLSLDAILGYHILPHVNIIRQPSIVKISLTFTIIFVVVGLINGILSIITFKNKTLCEVGCGLYLLGSSITTLLITTIFGLKFFILLLSQMALISNRLFSSFQCYSIDFLLRVCLSMDQWLNACVAIERSMTAIKGTRFDKKKSRQAAKIVIIILSIVIIGTSIHESIYRRLIDEDNANEKRTWCIATYPPGLQVFNSIIHNFHVFAPCMINLISAIILIRKKSYQQSNVQTHRNYKELLQEQFRQHKRLFTAPLLLVILALPRLIIAFTGKCMRTASDLRLFLVGYFISFIPPMLTFVIFILPSKFYKKEFNKTVAQYRLTIQRRLHLI